MGERASGYCGLPFVVAVTWVGRNNSVILCSLPGSFKAKGNPKGGLLGFPCGPCSATPVCEVSPLRADRAILLSQAGQNHHVLPSLESSLFNFTAALGQFTTLVIPFGPDLRQIEMISVHVEYELAF